MSVMMRRADSRKTWPIADVPEDVADEESAFVTQLVAVFAAASGTAFATYAEVVANAAYGPQIVNARRRYQTPKCLRSLGSNASRKGS